MSRLKRQRDDLSTGIGDHGRGTFLPYRKLLEEILLPKIPISVIIEVEHEFPVIGPRRMLLNARRIYQEGKGTDRILLAIEDITERWQIEEALKISETRYPPVFLTAQDGFIFILHAETGQISDV